MIVVYLSQPKYLLLLMQDLASKILCIFVTGGAHAPYAPCLSTPLSVCDVGEL